MNFVAIITILLLMFDRTYGRTSTQMTWSWRHLRLHEYKVGRDPQESEIAVKQGVKNYSAGIAIDAVDYLDLIRRSKLFIDHSLFMQAIYYKTRHDKIKILLPNNWGKTMTLGMIKLFYEMEVDEYGNMKPINSTLAYRVFVKAEIPLENGNVDRLEVPLAITRRECFIVDLMAQFPVIYANFKDALGDYVTVKRKVISEIRREFKRHEYMVGVLERRCRENISQQDCEDFKEFKDFLYGTAFHVEDVDKLGFLCQVLRSHFKVKPWILIDDYDTPLHNIIENGTVNDRDYDRFYRLMQSLTRNTFQYKNYHGAILTAIFESEFQRVSREPDPFYMAYDNEVLQDFFGFSWRIFQVLCKLFAIDMNLAKEAARWYVGFKPPDLFSQPSSVVKFLHERKLKVYWRDDRSMNFIEKVLHKQYKMRVLFLDVLSKKLQPFQERHFLSDEDDELFDLRHLPHWYEDERDYYYSTSVFLSYVTYKGYLTKNPWERKTQLPNIEMTIVLSTMLVKTYKRLYHIDDHLMDSVAVEVHSFLRQNENTTITIDDALTKLYKGAVNIKSRKDVVEVFNAVMLHIQCNDTFRFDAYYNKTKKSDVTMVDKQNLHGCVIDLTYNQSAEEAYRISDGHFIIKVLNGMHTIRFIGIDVALDHTVRTENILVHTRWGKNKNISCPSSSSSEFESNSCEFVY